MGVRPALRGRTALTNGGVVLDSQACFGGPIHAADTSETLDLSLERD